jgi:Rad3-related DNA helicase
LKVPAPEKFTHRTHKGLAACAEQKQGLELVEEPLDPGWLENFLDALAERATTEPTIVAVKNIEQTIRRQHISPSISILEPPAHIVDPEAVARLLAEPSFSPSELTLAIKLYLYAPTRRLDIPIHGDEYDVWAAKVACTEASAAYETLKSHRRSTCVMSHEQCLRGLMKGELKNHRIIIDDASMLEEAVSKAFGCDCGIAFLRAASTGNDALMKITDLIALWVEKVRANEDVHYITKADLALRETKGLLERLDAALALPLPAQTIDCLKNLRAILDDTNLPGRITYIETMMNGDHALHSVPDDIASLLRDRLYREAPTSLFVPQGSASMLRAIVTNDVPTILHSPNDTTSVSLEYTKDWEMRSWMENITGKAVLLVSSRRAIEDIFVKYTELLEALDITLLCQGTSGGASRLVGSFAGAKGKTILVVTPWMYEGFDLPPGSIDELVLNAIPFDHPHHAIYSQRGKRFAPQEFEHYTLPRTMHRMFRLLRAFCRHRKDDARFLITDERLTSRNYGPTIQSYLDRVTRSKSNEEEVSTDTTAETPKSPVKKEGKSATKNARKESANPNQQTLFGETEF